MCNIPIVLIVITRTCVLKIWFLYDDMMNGNGNHDDDRNNDGDNNNHYNQGLSKYQMTGNSLIYKLSEEYMQNKSESSRVMV